MACSSGDGPGAAPADRAGSAVRGEPRGHGAAGVASTRSGCSARPVARGAARCRSDNGRKAQPRSNGPTSGATRSRRWPGARISGCWPIWARRCCGPTACRRSPTRSTSRPHWLEHVLGRRCIRWSTKTPSLRRNALNCFADPMAVVDGVRRAAAGRQPSARHVQPARHRHRRAARHAPGRRRGAADEQAQIDAAFAEMPLDELHGAARERDARARRR